MAKGRLTKRIWGWAIYDWANSAFAVSILSIIFPIYFKQQLATSIGPGGNRVEWVEVFGFTIGSEAFWPMVVSFSMIFVVLLTPIVGAIAETLTPDGTMVKVRARMTVDMLVTLLTALLAVVLVVGYQVLGRWGHRFLSDD